MTYQTWLKSLQTQARIIYGNAVDTTDQGWLAEYKKGNGPMQTLIENWGHAEWADEQEPAPKTIQVTRATYH